MPSDQDLLQRIAALVNEERELRDRAAGHGEQAVAHERLAELEVALDQCWDLLRQRQALRDSGQSADSASVRPAEQVENYLG